MSVAPVGSLGLELGLSSSANTGDVLNTPDFNVTFGDKVAGKKANSSPTFLGGILKELAIGLAVALAAKYAWSKIK